MLFAILRHLPCTDYMKWNKGELNYHRVWFSKDEVSLGLYMCRCKEWLNINLVRSYNTALLKEMRYVYLVSQTVLPLSMFAHMYFNQGKGLALCGTDNTVWMACMCCIALPCIAYSKQKEGGPMLHYTLPSLYILRAVKQWR